MTGPTVPSAGAQWDGGAELPNGLLEAVLLRLQRRVRRLQCAQLPSSTTLEPAPAHCHGRCWQPLHPGVARPRHSSPAPLPPQRPLRLLLRRRFRLDLSFPTPAAIGAQHLVLRQPASPRPSQLHPHAPDRAHALAPSRCTRLSRPPPPILRRSKTPSRPSGRLHPSQRPVRAGRCRTSGEDGAWRLQCHIR